MCAACAQPVENSAGILRIKALTSIFTIHTLWTKNFR